jgi:citrate lyase beta subunit
VRINALDTGLAEDDLDAVLGADLDVLVLPKVDDADHLAYVDSRLAGASVELIALVDRSGTVRAIDRRSSTPHSG